VHPGYVQVQVLDSRLSAGEPLVAHSLIVGEVVHPDTCALRKDHETEFPLLLGLFLTICIMRNHLRIPGI
jgi:hypothetical protein